MRMKSVAEREYFHCGRTRAPGDLRFRTYVDTNTSYPTIQPLERVDGLVFGEVVGAAWEPIFIESSPNENVTTQ